MNLFDTIDDELDLEEFSDRELNRYFDLGCLQSMMTENDPYACKDDNVIDVLSTKLLSTDVILSQELSQLSTDSEQTHMKRSLSTPSHSQSPPVKRQMIDQDVSTTCKQDDLPEFIRLTYPHFQRWILDYNDIVQVLGLSDLQQLLFVQYQTEMYDIKKLIYDLHSKCGVGTLLNNETNLFVDVKIDRSVWLREILESMHDQRRTTVSIVSTDSDSCQQFVRQKIEAAEQEMNRYQDQRRTIEHAHKDSLTSSMIETIRTYLVTHGFRRLHWKRDLKVDLVHNEYRTIILERCFRASNPTREQIDRFKRLCEAKYDVERARRDLIDLKQRVFNQKLPTSIESIDNEQDQSFMPMYINEYERCLQIHKLDTMIGMIRRSEEFYSDKYQQFERLHRQLNETTMSNLLMSIIDEILLQIRDKLRRIYEYRTKQYLWHSHDDQRCTTLQPSMIISARHRFNVDQLKLLTRGPSYIPPCQLLTKIQSASLSMNDYLKQQYAPMKHRLAHIFAKHKLSIAGTLTISQRLHEKFNQLFSVMNVPSEMHQRSTYELSLVDDIRRLLDEDRLVLRRTADNFNQFYLGDAYEFDSQCEQYLENMTFVRCMMEIDHESADSTIRSEVNETVDDINRTIKALQTNSIITTDVANRLTVDMDKVDYPILYFLPDISTLVQDMTMSVSPRFASDQGPTMKLAQYLQSVLRPLVDSVLQSKTFHSPLEFIEKLDYYGHRSNHFKASTLFCCLSIRNFHQLVTHSIMIDVVECFIRDNSVTNRLGNHSLSTIETFLRMFLTNNHFRYKNKVFTFVKGSPASMPLSSTLSNIYVHEWQELIERELRLRDELSGRIDDQMFFTWNGSRDELDNYLKKLQEKQPTVEFDYKINGKLSYFGAWIENRQGQLYTRTDTNSSGQRYTLPYVRGHTKREHADWYRSALNRAVCYCSSVHDFHRERIRLELSLLTAGYSLMFVESHVEHFLGHFQGKTVRYSNDSNVYHSFRLQWLEMTKRKFTDTTHYRMMDHHGRIFRFDYFYELGNRTEFNRYFIELCSTYLEKQRALSKDKFLVLLSTQQRSSLNALLGRYRWFESMKHS